MEIKPYEGVGTLLFSDNRKVIREKLDVPFESGARGKGEFKEHYDYFKELGLFAYYDENDKLWAFEFFESAPFFEGVDLLSQTYMNLLGIFLKLDPNLEVGFNDFVSSKYGIGSNTNDDPESVDAQIEALIVFKRGYYDRW